MRFSLLVICNSNESESVLQKVNDLTDYLRYSREYSFLPYRKDDKCATLEISGVIENPDYDRIMGYVQLISGVKDLSVGGPQDDWECACYSELSVLHANNGIAFVVCNIFDERYLSDYTIE